MPEQSCILYCQFKIDEDEYEGYEAEEAEEGGEGEEEEDDDGYVDGYDVAVCDCVCVG